MYLNIGLGILILLSFSVYGSEKSYWSRIKFMAELDVKSYEKKYIKQTSDEFEAIASHSIGISLPLVYNFSVATNLTFITTSLSSEKETNRDEDIQDATGKNIRLVERKISYEYNEDPNFAFLLEYNFIISKMVTITPFIGFSLINGKFESERYDMTDRDTPLLFSKHNRYTLTSKTEFKRRNIIIGSKLYLKELFIFSLQYTVSKIKFSNISRNININGETIAFDDDDYYFEKFTEGQSFKDSAIMFGFGVYL